MDDFWPRLLADYDKAEDKAAYRNGLGAGVRSSFDNRQEEWSEIQTVSAAFDLAGKNVLVVGAGLGFDANLLLHRGARITAVDLNPQTNSIGARQTPAARWIGGLGRSLPFVDDYFDFVFINAALHHVLDVSATVVEMLRVVKPGGSVITSSDSYARDDQTDQEDAKSWNDHAAVLRGINENRHRLQVYIDPLLVRADALDIEYWTSRAYGLWNAETKTYDNLLTPTRWDLLADHKRLRESAGGMFMRVTKKHAIGETFRPAGEAIMAPSDLSQFIGRKTEAMAHLAHLAPAAFVTKDFPGPPGNTKFQVLNGWRWREPGERGRQAYLCGRWFTRRPRGASQIFAELRAPMRENAVPAEFQIAVDGRVRVTAPVKRGQTETLSVDIADAPFDRPIAIELRMSISSEDFDDGLFQVETCFFVGAASALIGPARLAHFNRAVEQFSRIGAKPS
jgi:SAM-dependent methyltransferase